MKSLPLSLFTGILLVACRLTLFAEPRVTIERNEDNPQPGFQFKNVPPPSSRDAAGRATFTVVDGEADGNGGYLGTLQDGLFPHEEDEPSENFFFHGASNGGRIGIDLGRAIEIGEIRTYSWHAGSRGPQVYTVYGSDGTNTAFNAAPKKGTSPESCGWKRIAEVDTRPRKGEGGGQHGVRISGGELNPLGPYRHLLFDISRTNEQDTFSNTFFSEIDVIDAKAPAVPEQESDYKPLTHVVDAGKYQIVLNTTAAPDLTQWAEKSLGPVVQEWYPKIAEMLPDEGYEPPTRVIITFRDGMKGTPAWAARRMISCNIEWFRKNLEGEARGAVVHELVHVAQQYGRPKATAEPAPGWIVEGIPDYIRWFLYEPQSKGAEIGKDRIEKVSYDNSYRVTANFLEWATRTHDKEIVKKLNSAARQGEYKADLWQKWTGKTLADLNDAWKKDLEKRAR
jgi:hypothetical protein